MAEPNQEPQAKEPQASRPHLPDNYGVPRTKKGMLPWSRAREILETAKVYWVCTVRPDGRPHARPIWCLWVDDKLYCDGSLETRWARNLRSNPAVQVHTEQDGIVVILHGVAELTKPEPATAERLAEVSATKYGFRPDAINEIYAVRPVVAYAWGDLGSATRWHFGEG
jgi:nitroimidazol reductase NimA-like FMN-containing flavoprotein (pyridoxamine 5'-phosphate oxidase superfamily)